MNLPAACEPDRRNLAAIERYYRMHARIYDLTRWTFLRGREALIKQVAASLTPNRILEVGCGTGTNLLNLGKAFPQAHLWGLDLSTDMLAVAGKNSGPCPGAPPWCRPPMTSRWLRPPSLIWWFSPMPYPCSARAANRPSGLQAQTSLPMEPSPWWIFTTPSSRALKNGWGSTMCAWTATSCLSSGAASLPINGPSARLTAVSGLIFSSSAKISKT